MKVLYVAYPLNGVSAESCGGAEQMLHTVEAGFARRGHETVVAACAGSRVAGRLEATGNADPPLDSFEQRDAAHNARVLQILHQARLSGHPFDLVHDHGGSFWRLADGIREPVLLTAHHARHFYGDDLARAPQNAFVNCVSETQSASFDDVTSLVGTVRNGIVLARFPFEEEKSDYLLWLGRICHEKGAHVALDAGRRLGMRVVIAGDVYSFSYHQQYFEREVLPRINGADAELVIRPSLARKIELLARARAVLIPSMVDEASSLVAMEAAACGTPVIAFRRGALPEVVVEGKTGFVVDTPGGMALAVSRTPEISPDICRRHAQENFGADRMVTKYEALYWRVRRMCERRPVPAAA